MKRGRRKPCGYSGRRALSAEGTASAKVPRQEYACVSGPYGRPLSLERRGRRRARGKTTAKREPGPVQGGLVGHGRAVRVFPCSVLVCSGLGCDRSPAKGWPLGAMGSH